MRKKASNVRGKNRHFCRFFTIGSAAGGFGGEKVMSHAARRLFRREF